MGTLIFILLATIILAFGAWLAVRQWKHSSELEEARRKEIEDHKASLAIEARRQANQDKARRMRAEHGIYHGGARITKEDFTQRPDDSGIIAASTIAMIVDDSPASNDSHPHTGNSSHESHTSSHDFGSSHSSDSSSYDSGSSFDSGSCDSGSSGGCD